MTDAASERSAAALPPADIDRLLARLPGELATVVERAAAVSRRSTIPVYLVGGLVRDLVLGVDSRDLDLVVEGDGIAFAAELAAATGGRPGRRHPAFLTAEVILPDGTEIDVASARDEVYAEPAALPTVRPAGLGEDLLRRDFTVNALAVRLGPESPFAWVDPLGGSADLRRRTLRVLHDASFVDDPTRLLRAVRLEARLGLRMDPGTEELARRAVAEGAFAALSGSRLRDELLRLLGEPETALTALERLAGLGWLGVLDRGLRWGRAERRWMDSALAAWQRLRGLEALAERPPRASWLLLAALAEGPDPELADAGVAARLAERLQLAGADRALVVGEARRRARALLGPARGAEQAPAPHLLAAALDPLRGEDLVLLATGAGGDAVGRYLEELAGFRLRITGSDLLAAGVAAGPAMGAALERTRNARLDGEIEAEDELSFALSQATRGADR